MMPPTTSIPPKVRWMSDREMAVSLRSTLCFFQAEDGIRDAQESRGLGDVYKRQPWKYHTSRLIISSPQGFFWGCLLYTSDAADDLTRVDLGGRRIIKKKKKKK